MAKATEFKKTALVIGILSAYEEKHDELIRLLTEHFGNILAESEVMDFPYTDYYDEEMSGHPVRYLLLFSSLVNPERLSEIKLLTNKLEERFAGENGRRINIDPGVLSLANFILATCKDRSHRIPLSSGVYGEVTLIYQNKDFQSLPWTYSDYNSAEVKAVLRNFREKFKILSRRECQDGKTR